MEHKTKQLFVAIIAIVILVAIAVLLFKGSEQQSGELTAEQKQEILNVLSQEPDPIDLSDDERSGILENLSQEGGGQELTQEEKQEILNALGA
jgi:hypothetical protein